MEVLDPIRPRLSRLPGVVAAFSTRRGGASTAPFASLNLGLRLAGEDEQVYGNLARFFGEFGIDPEQIATAEQVHGAGVARVSTPGKYAGVDALVTDVTGLPLCIATADCAAVLLADPQARAVGACHSGWRGTVANIVSNTVHEMTALGAERGRIQAFVSPCISAANFEVGEEVAAQFDPRYVIRHESYARPHVDLKAVLRDQMEDAGIPAPAMEFSPFCTVEHTDLFYSYRAEGGRTGRMLGFVMLAP
ncbi:MAG TPA: peptidoglycan editing factor PgeF [Rhodothermales bacterium]